MLSYNNNGQLELMYGLEANGDTTIHRKYEYQDSTLIACTYFTFNETRTDYYGPDKLVKRSKTQADDKEVITLLFYDKLLRREVIFKKPKSR